MKKNQAYLLLQKFVYASCIIGIMVTLAGCGGTCAVITKFEAEPEWVCPGGDLSVNVHYKIEIFDEDGEHYEPLQEQVLIKLFDVTKADLSTPGPIASKPGTISLTSKLGTPLKTSPGVLESPASGFNVVGVPQAQSFRFALVATCTDCTDEGEKYLLSHQDTIEKYYGVELDDDEIMTALTTISMVQAGAPKRLCVPYVEDVTDGWYFVKEEVRAGKAIVIDYVENTNPFPVNVMPPGQPSKILSASGQQGATTHDYDGDSPNGKWKIKITNQSDHDNFIKHDNKYLGKPSICITVGIRCQ